MGAARLGSSGTCEGGLTCLRVKWSEVENMTTVLCMEFSSSLGWNGST